MFTQKQKRALARASPAARPKLRAMFASQDQRRRNRRPTGRATASRVLAQGVGAAPSVPFGGRDSYSLECWDAKLLHHLPLPRAVGPYTIIRTTRRFASSSRNIVFGPMQRLRNNELEWSTVCAIRDVTSVGFINDPDNAFQIAMPMQGLGAAVTVTPAAFSVQIMNPEALQTTEGIIYAGIMNTQAKIADRTETWDDWMDKFVEFQTPRLLSAAKLSLRGVQVNSYPLNMTEVSKFTRLAQDNDNTFTYNENGPEVSGWAPILVYNAGGQSNPTLEYLVTCEWRVRFDLDHPASASHTHHPVASDMTWDKLMRAAVSLGNGVSDIVETVANVGQMASRYAGRARPLLALGA